LNELLTGAHVSIAGGLHKAFEQGARLQCRAIQIFLKNTNQWKAKLLTEPDRILFEAAWKNSGIKAVAAHDSYLINLASPNRELFQRSLDAFIEEMRRASFLGVSYLVMHPGAHTGSGMAAGIASVARALNRALKAVGPPVQILLENTAGQGSCLGHRFEHLADILGRIKDSDRVGVCLDTCHLFAAGYDIRTKAAYAETIREFNRRVGIKKIKVFHVNDSKKDLGSRVDRHCHIGQGCIGLDAFRFLINDRRFSAIPKILETPKGAGIEEDLMNLSTLAALAGLQGSDRRKVNKYNLLPKNSALR
jgi:deoxyribonuclease IV